MRKTSVSTPVASFAQSMLLSSFVGSSWPVITANDDASARCVTGMPAYAGAAIADVTPGSTSNGTPAATSASASSPPRPKTNGSPPFSRTTRLPSRPLRDEQRVDLVLRQRVPVRHLADVHQLRIRTREREQRGFASRS